MAQLDAIERAAQVETHYNSAPGAASPLDPDPAPAERPAGGGAGGKDITLDRRFSSICDCTDADLDTVFAPELPGLDRSRIRDWYNGYWWLGDEKAYNPFDILLLFDHRRFDAWWFETGTPSFLVKTLAKRGVGSVDLDGMSGTETLLSAFDVDVIEPEALLFQTGYLTITHVEDRTAARSIGWAIRTGRCARA